MFLIDSHCHLDHLDLSKHNNCLADALLTAEKQDVKFFLCVCITLEDFPTILNIAKQHENVCVSVGLHPNESVTTEPAANDLIRLAQHPKVIAIGETGLDYFRETNNFTSQQGRFIQHIDAAKQLNKPLIVHTRQARADTIDILKAEQADRCGGVMHCFTEDWDMAKAALDLGFYISISGIVTFKNALEIQDVAKKIPLDRLLIETDSPYLAPLPHRGKANEPAYVRLVAEYIAQLRNIPLEELAEQTTANFDQLFQVSSRAHYV